MSQLDRLAIGETAEIRRRITVQDVERFIALTGDNNPIHRDADAARAEHLEGPIVHGMLTASFVSTVIGTLLPGPGSLWTSVSLRFLHPLVVGSEARCRVGVRHRSPAAGSVVLGVMVTDEKDRTVLSGEATVMIPQRTRGGSVDATLQQRTPRPEMSRTADGRTVLVAGATGEIGRAICLRLASSGVRTAVNYRRSAEAADRIVADIEAAGGTAVAVQADLTDAGQVDEAVRLIGERLGGPCDLVYCAAERIALGGFADLAWAEIDRQLRSQVGGAFNCVQALLPALVADGRGSLVFVGSIASEDAPPAGQTDYVIAKAALTALARSLAVEVGPRGVRVNVVAPGMTGTGLSAAFPEKSRLLARMQAPLRRLTSPTDIADAVAFLLSDRSSQITGQVLRVDGGTTM